MNIVWAYVTLIRVPNCLVAAAAVAVGQYLTPDTNDFRVNAWAMATAFFVCGFGNIINDIRDIETDRINHPRRALPSGKISTDRARTLAFFFLLISLLLMVGLNGVCRLVVVASILLVIWYNLHLKHTMYWGNSAVSLLGGMTFLLGGATYGWTFAVAVPGPIIPAFFALLMHFGREIIKDIEDRAGDARAGCNTAPARSGTSGPVTLAGILFALLILASLSVYLAGWFNRIYFYIVLIFIQIPLVVQFLWLIARPERSRFRLVSAALKLEMVAGLAAIILGRSY